MANGTISVSDRSSIDGHGSQMATGDGTKPLQENSPFNGNELRNAPETPVNEKTAPPSGVTISRESPTSNPEHIASPSSVLGVYSSASDPVLVRSIDSRVPGAIGTIKREVRIQRAAADSNLTIPAETISANSQEFADGPQVNDHDITNSNLSLSINEKAVWKFMTPLWLYRCQANPWDLKTPCTPSCQNPLLYLLIVALLLVGHHQIMVVGLNNLLALKKVTFLKLSPVMCYF